MNAEEKKLIDIQETAHAEWLHHPCTIQMFKVMKAHESSLLDNTNAKAEDIVSAVRTIRAMKTIMTSSPKFVELANKKQ